MKKRVLSVLLVVALLVAVGIVAAQADTTYTPDQIIELSAAQSFVLEEGKETVSAPCYACNGETVEWKPLTAGGEIAGGHYFLAGEITTTTDTYGIRNLANKKMCLHLNGQNITFSALHAPMVALYNGGTEMNIFASGSKIQQSANGWATVVGTGNGIMNVYGGTYTNIATDQRNLFEVKSGTLNLYNVTGTIANRPELGNVLANGGTVNIENSTIPNATAKHANGVLNIKSGSAISKVTATAGRVSVSGGTVGSLIGGASATAINVSGNPTIGEIDLTASAVKLTIGELTSGASIGLGSTTSVFTEPFATPEAAEAAKAYIATSPAGVVTVTDAKELRYDAKTYTKPEIVTESKKQSFGDQAVTVNAFCYACGKMTDWKPLTSAATSVSGHYFLPDDLITTTNWGFTANTGKLCLHLNGNTIGGQTKDTTHCGIRVGAIEFNLMGNGTVQNSAINWTALDVQNAASVVNVYGGSFVNHYGTGSNNYTIGAKAGVTNIYDATILNTPTGAPGKLYVSTGGTANVYGGTMVIQTRDNDANKLNIYDGTFGYIDAMSGEVYISGGTITKLTGTETKDAAVKKIQLSGDPTISQLVITSSPVKLTIGELTSGASINLGTTAGVITEPFASPEAAETAKPYFTVAAGMILKVTDANELSYEKLSITTTEGKIQYANVEMPKIAGFQGTEEFVSYCPHCDRADIVWKPLGETGGFGFNSFHYFATTDRTATIGCDSAPSHNSCLYLNGKNIGTVNVYGERELTIIGQGTVTGNAQSALTGGGTINVYGGTYGNANTTDKIVSSVSTSGTLNFYDGIITQAKSYGIYFNNGVVNLKGGELQDAVYMDTNGESDPVLNINGGNMTGESIGSGRGTVNINGGTFNGTQFAIGGGTYVPALNLNGGTFTNVTLNNHGDVGTTTFGANFDQTITVSLENERVEGETVYGKTALLYAAPGGLKATVYATDIDKNVYGLVYDTTANDGSLVVARTAIVNGETTSWYENNEQAVAAYDGNGYIKLTVDDQLTLRNKDITVDLRGLLVDVYGEGTLTGFDTKTKGNYGVTPGAIVIDDDANITTAVPETQTAADGTVSGYLPVAYDGETSFSYFEMKLSGIALKANKDTVGLYYKGIWSFNKNLPEAANVTAGVVVNAEDALTNNEDPISKGFRSNPANGYSELNAANIANDQPVTSLLIKDIMLATNEAAKNSNYGQIKIKAAAYVTVNGVDFDVTGTKNMSVQDVLKMFEEPGREEAYNNQKTKLAGFYNDWVTKANLDTWGLTKIGQSVES